MKKIPLTKGKFAIVDDEDYDEMMRYKWHFRRDGYAGAKLSNHVGGAGILMHRLILGAKNPTQRADHINGIGIDNRRSNLRFATHQQNVFNRGKYRNNKAGLKGVCRSCSNRWRAQITLNGRQIYLGVYDDKDSAHAAYCAAAKRYHGEFSHT